MLNVILVNVPHHYRNVLLHQFVPVIAHIVAQVVHVLLMHHFVHLVYPVVLKNHFYARINVRV